LEVLVLRVRAIQAKLGLEGNREGQTSLQTFLNGVSRWVYEVVEELEYIETAGVRHGKIFLKDLVKALLIAIFWGGVKLKEVLKGLDLNLEEVRIINCLSDGGERNPFLGLVSGGQAWVES
jgi:hypothetical protein